MKRVWVDANVLLRFLTDQPQDLAERARAFLEQVDRGEVEDRRSIWLDFKQLALALRRPRLAASGKNR